MVYIFYSVWCLIHDNNKYRYDIDISTALKLAQKYFIRRDTDHGIDLIRLMNQYVHAVKTEFRQFDRPLRAISAIHFHYRNILWCLAPYIPYIFDIYTIIYSTEQFTEHLA